MTDVVQDMDTSEKSEVAETEMAAPEQANGTINGKEEVSEAATDVTVTKKKVVSESAAESAPENGNGELSESKESSNEEKTSAPTSVIQSVPKVTDDEKTNLEDSDKTELDIQPPTDAPPSDLLETDSGKEASCTVADLIEEEEEEEEAKEEEKEENKEEEKEVEKEVSKEEEEEQVEEEVKEGTEEKVTEKEEEAKEKEVEEETVEESEDKEAQEEGKQENGEKEEKTEAEEAEVSKEADKAVSEKSETDKSDEMTKEEAEEKKAESRVQKTEDKSAAELAYEWDDDGVEDEKPKKEEKKTTPKKKSAAVLKAEAEVTPGRKSSRTPKPTQRKLESESQKNLKDPEEDKEEDEEDEESVDAIAKELEKSDSSDSKKSPAKAGKGTPKKKGKPVSEEKSKEEWVNLIFGENGEKVTDKGRKVNEDKPKDSKTGDEEEGPEGEQLDVPDDTPKAKKGGRPKKKGLDEIQDGVAKLGSNMYFYTGPQGSESPPLDSDEEDLPIKKADSEPARKSGRANKGRNKRLERGDEVVDIPQVKEAPKPNLNPSWLKNHDSKKDSPASKKAATPVVKSTPAAKETPAKKAKKEEEDTKEEAMDTEPAPEIKSTPRGRPKKKVVEKEAEKEKEEEKEVEEEAEKEAEKESADEVVNSETSNDTPSVSKSSKKESVAPPSDAELPEFDPEKFTPGYVPKTVKKGEDEYMIVVSGVKDTGLCGNYWSVGEGGRRRSKPPETLQMGKNERRGSVGSVSSEKSAKGSPATSVKKAAATPTPKSAKKQVTKPEKVESGAEEEETKTPVSSGRGRKRKTDTDTPATDKKIKKEEDDTKEFSDYDSGNNETQPLRKKPKKGQDGDKDSPSKESALTSKQQTAVAAALAAGVPGGQQRSVSCVADTNTQKEVVVECFAPYDDHRWVNIGKERDGMAPDAVQYARALRPPYHLLSFLRIKGHSTKGMSCTDKNTMVFVVLEGEITVILHTTQFNAKKGDSFYIPPKNYYNLINQKAREAELSLIQFQYDGPLPTVQPSNS